jgi:hypothetical protein
VRVNAADYEAQLSELRAKVDALEAEREHFRTLYLQMLEVCRKLELGIVGPKRERLSDSDAQLTMSMLGMLLDGAGRGPATTPGKPSATTRFEYDSARFGLGKLASATSADGVTTVLAYEETFGAVRSQHLYVPGQNGGAPLATDTTYDAFGRPDVLTYPGAGPRFAVRHVYGAANGSLQKVVRHDQAGTVFWEATGRDDLGQLTG